MTDPKPASRCPDCDGVSRRTFLKGLGGAALASGALAIPAVAARPAAAADASGAGTSETLVTQLYGTLTDAQKQKVCFGWDHPKRQMINNNWMIVPQKIGEFYTPEQQEIIRGIFKGAHSSDEWVQRRMKQLKDDAGGLEQYSIALFGTPGSGRFEWVMAGRHLTLRVDGHSQPGMAFGGPIFYGHAADGHFNEAKEHPDNVYWYQAKRANEVFQALDGKQRKLALQTGDIPSDSPGVLVPHAKAERPGVPVSDLSHDQQELVGKVLQDLLAPMRQSDVEVARQYLHENGGLHSLSLAFYQKDDIGNDGVWDVWMMEGPAMVWYFRGSPHVHTWVAISQHALTTAPPAPEG